MDAFAQGARKARAAEALLRDETSTARAVRRERFHSAALILTLGVFAVAFLLLSHANVSSLPGAAAIALGGAMTRSTKPAGHARSGVLASLGVAPFARASTGQPQMRQQRSSLRPEPSSFCCPFHSGVTSKRASSPDQRLERTTSRMNESLAFSPRVSAVF